MSVYNENNGMDKNIILQFYLQPHRVLYLIILLTSKQKLTMSQLIENNIRNEDF